MIIPNYQGTIPSIVKEFIARTTLNANYIFGIIAYGANNCNGNEELVKYCEKYNIQPNYVNSILMVDNAFIRFNMEKQIKKLP